MDTIIKNKEEFLNVTIKQISQVYKGRQNICRCGCAGDYTSTSYMLVPRSDVNDILVQEYLDKAKKLVKKGAKIWCCSTFVDVTTGKDKTLTFYFDDIK